MLSHTQPCPSTYDMLTNLDKPGKLFLWSMIFQKILISLTIQLSSMDYELGLQFTLLQWLCPLWEALLVEKEMLCPWEYYVWTYHLPGNNQRHHQGLSHTPQIHWQPHNQSGMSTTRNKHQQNLATYHSKCIYLCFGEQLCPQHKRGAKLSMYSPARNP